MSAIASESDGSILIIRFTDSRILEESKIRQAGDEMIALLDRTRAESVLLDLHGVGFMSSAMLGTLIRFHKKCKEYKVELRLCDIAPEILQVFKLTRLDKVFAIHADRTSARASFGI
ncbi:MAG: hypothetical protein A2W31_12780 [Planctomycetes bacterium RBG_16_64_10]|nr:MAG: hypothetical protein A2W31_12780 [Planctomycetes bacterium RBG_16_64_10]